jgi:hypothetical protein
LLKALHRSEKEGKDFVLRFVGYVPENVRSEIASQLNPDKVVFILILIMGKLLILCVTPLFSSSLFLHIKTMKP